ncbi:MAG: hypothetical protein LBC48_03140, partial [Dysgonamonadaceae bacterium]|nr:hypothetical protein [Dysgonamonadaceae bacterium]
MKKVLFLTILPFLLLGTAGVKAQVAIGNETGPHLGAVLDLSQATELGLLLPRVSLVNTKDWQLKGTDADGKGKGMLVYNANEDTDGGNGEGIYVWKGEWVPVQSLHGSHLCSGTPVITETNPSSLNVSAPISESPILSVTADGKGAALTYKWQYSTDKDAGAWTTADGTATTDTYTILSPAEGTYYYRCIVKNACGTTISKVFEVSITPCTDAAPTISAP